MIIHVVEKGDTLNSISDKYKISPQRLIQDNGLIMPDHLVIGQTIVIAYPTETYIVKPGDTLENIAQSYNINIMQLYRNNSFLSNREMIYPGETLVIRYDNTKAHFSTNGYCYPFIDKSILKKTLPYLTYLSIFNYRATPEGDIIGIEDTELIKIAKDYGVAPIMLLSSQTPQGLSSIEAAYGVLYNEKLQDRHIEVMLNTLKSKGYYGINISFQYISPNNYTLYNKYFNKITTVLHNAGFKVFVTVSPKRIYVENQSTFERVDYTEIGKLCDGIMLLSYEWGYSYGPPGPPTAFQTSIQFIEYVETLVPHDKILIGLPIIAYDWELPFELGVTRGISLTPDAAIALAYEVGSPIVYDEIAKAPNFTYLDMQKPTPAQHVVWFKDARSIDAIINLIPQYDLEGTGIWNIMYYFAQMWTVINTQYEIDKIKI